MAEKFPLIAKVATKGEKEGQSGNLAVLELEEADGGKFNWISFDPSAVKDVQVGKTYQFMVSRPPNKNGGRPYRNIESVIGPADLTVARPGPATSTDDNDSGGQLTAQLQAIEIQSVERRGAVDVVLRLMGLGVSLDDMGLALERVLGLAERVEAYYGHTEGASGTIDQAEVSGGGNDDTPKLESVGDLLNAVKAKFGKASPEVCEALGVGKPVEIKDYQAAWSKLVGLWS